MVKACMFVGEITFVYDFSSDPPFSLRCRPSTLMEMMEVKGSRSDHRVRIAGSTAGCAFREFLKKGNCWHVEAAREAQEMLPRSSSSQEEHSETFDWLVRALESVGRSGRVLVRAYSFDQPDVICALKQASERGCLTTSPRWISMPSPLPSGKLMWWFIWKIYRKYRKSMVIYGKYIGNIGNIW